jgi:hypothetical protein
MRVLAAICLLAATGCSATVDEPVDDGEPLASDSAVQGTVVIESTTVLPTSPARVRSHVSARFLRVSGLETQAAERVVGANASSIADAPTGCIYQDSDVAPVPADDASIELLDVGDIMVHVLRSGMPDVTLPLAARAFPDVGELVSGVVYTSRDESTALPEASTYLIETTGSALVEGFSLRLEAPAAPTGVRLAGVDLEEGESPIVTSGDALPLSWIASEDDADRIVVEVEPLEPGVDGSVAVQCIFADQGQAVVPSAYTGFASGTEIEVVIRRYRRRPVKLPSVDEAFVDFDFAVTARAIVD